MCSCDNDTPTLYKEQERTARKRHRCAECTGLIEPGTRYSYARGVWEGEFFAYHTCLDCKQASLLLECAAHSCVLEDLGECFDIRVHRDVRHPADQQARDAIAGMKRRHRQAERVLRQEVAA